MILLAFSIVLTVNVALGTSQGCSSGPADVMFVLGSDSSVDIAKVEQKIRVMEAFVKSVKIGANDIQVGLITEYNFADLEFHMDDHMDNAELSLAINFTYFQTRNSSYGVGLEYIRKNGMDGGLGGRPGVSDVVIFLTDGILGDSSLAQNEAKKLTDAGVTVIAAAGGTFAKPDLINVASGCHYIAQTPDLSSTGILAGLVVNLTCDAINGVSLDDCECDLTADLVFLLDASSAQGKDNFNAQKNFTETFVSDLNISPNGTRVATVTYATFAHPHFPLEAHTNKTELAVALSFVPFQSDDDRYIAESLQFISDNIFAPRLPPRDLTKKIVILTATGSLSDPLKANAEALRLKNLGTTIISIGVGVTGPHELASLASDNFVEYFQSFSDLIAAAPSLRKGLCQNKRVQATTASPGHVTPHINACIGGTPCQNGGTCVEVFGVKSCQCPQNYGGNICENYLSVASTLKHCNFNPCRNGGTCLILGDMYECRCPYGFQGLTCNDLTITTTIVPLSTISSTTSLPNGQCSFWNTTNGGCGKAEVVFMIEFARTDISGTIDHETDFVNKVLNNFRMHTEYVRVGIVVYHDEIIEVVHITDYLNNVRALRRKIKSLPSTLNPSGEANFAKALDFVRQNSFMYARSGVPKVVIPIVHQTPMPTLLPEVPKAAERLKNDCVTLYIMGVRLDPTYRSVIQQIATQPLQDYYIYSPDFSELEHQAMRHFRMQCT